MSSPSDAGNEDYEVGFKKPPLETRFKKGQSGNPGGMPKGFEPPSKALKRMGDMPLDALRACKPRSALEEGYKRQLLGAVDIEDDDTALRYMTASADRVEGKPRQVTENTTKDLTRPVERTGDDVRLKLMAAVTAMRLEGLPIPPEMLTLLEGGKEESTDE